MDDSRTQRFPSSVVSPNDEPLENRDYAEPEVSPSRTNGRFGEVEDVISVGALMRPTLEKAMSALSPAERVDLKNVLLEVEQHLAKASLPYRDRFALIRETFTRTFRYGPLWRFISGRIEECWSASISPSLREFSMVSLLIGMIFEELHRANGTTDGVLRVAKRA